MRPLLKIMTVVGVLFAAAGAGGYILMRDPTLISARYTLKLATGPVGSDGQKLLAAFVRVLSEEHPQVRLVPMPTETLSESGRALRERRADLAVVRSDDAAAAEGRTIFVLRQDGIAILLPPASKIENASELSARKLAVAQDVEPGLLKAVTDFYGLREADRVGMPSAELGLALKAGRVAGAIAFGPLGPGPITDAFAGIRKSFKAKPTYLDLPEADVIAARVVGAGPIRLMFRTILPNCLGPLIVQATLSFSNAILDAAALGFLGLGAQPPTPEWGTMLAEAREFVLRAWWVVTFPGLAILVTVLAINLIGDGLRDALDPKMRRS